MGYDSYTPAVHRPEEGKSHDEDPLERSYADHDLGVLSGRELPAEGPGQRSLVEIALSYGVPDREILKLDRFVRLVVLEGKPVAAAARLVGWRSIRGWKVMQGTAYQEMRAELLSRHARTVDDVHNEIFNVVADTAIHGAIRQNALVKESDNDVLVNEVANKAMDRIGARAPERQEVKHEVELSETTVALIAKAFEAVKMTKAIDLERDYGFCLERPEADEDRAMKRVGTAAGVEPKDS